VKKHESNLPFNVAEPRYELKSSFPSHLYESVILSLRTSTLAIRPLHPDRRVQSIYFDTPMDRAVSENLAGMSIRAKIRFRWYGHSTNDVHGQLECKRRRDVFVIKEMMDVDKVVSVSGASRRQFGLDMERMMPSHWRALGLLQEPVQWVVYDRTYFATPGETVRITVDRHVSLYDQRQGPQLQALHKTACPAWAILELKAASGNNDELKKVARLLPFHFGSCSKFMMASRPGQRAYDESGLYV
jgi:hypothetical protein